MSTQYYMNRISSSMVCDVVDSLPFAIGRSVLSSISSDERVVLDEHQNDVVRASYDPEDGSIILHVFTVYEIDHFDYVDILLHEIAHKIFNEMLKYEDRIFWARAHKQEKFPIELRDIYVAECLWEEEFCISFSLVYFEVFLRRNNMDEAAKKIKKALDEMPGHTKAIQDVVAGVERSLNSRKKAREGCYQRVHERVRKFVFGDSDILSFDNK